MERNLLKEEIKEIKMPHAMQERILENCRNAGLNEEGNVFMTKKISVDTNNQNTRKSAGSEGGHNKFDGNGEPGGRAF